MVHMNNSHEDAMNSSEEKIVDYEITPYELYALHMLYRIPQSFSIDSVMIKKCWDAFNHIEPIDTTINKTYIWKGC